MSRDMKTVTITKRSRFRVLHIEAPGCIVNIRVGLTREDGCEVTRIDVMADADRYRGEPPWWMETEDLNSATATGLGVRVVRAAAP